MKALLLCAGYGKRLRPYTAHSSKVTLPFLNAPIVSYPLNLLESFGVQSLTINTHHCPKQVEETVRKLKPSIPHLHFSYEPHLLGGAGTIKKNQQFLQGDDFIYLNGDSVFLSSEFFSKMKKQHSDTQAGITFLAVPAKSKKEENIWANPQKQVSEKIFKNTAPNQKPYFFPGFALVHSRCFDYLKQGDQNIFTDLAVKIPQLCFVYIQNDLQFFEIGNLKSYLESTKMGLHILSQPNEKSLKLNHHLKRFTNSVFKTFTKNGETSYVLYGKNVKECSHNQIKDFAVIGDHCMIDKNVLIQGGVLGSKLHLKENLSHTFKLF